ncbi:MAG: FtsX-like permease family protein [Terriglobales bacterium]
MTVAQAAADCAVIFRRSVEAQAAAARNPKQRESLQTQTLPVTPAATGASLVRDQFAQPLWILFALVGVVLLIVAVNLGGMLLAQAESRQREFAMRLALGAGRGRLIRQLLTESLLLTAAGGLLGWWLAQCGARALVALVAQGDALTALSLGGDARVLAFTVGACTLAGIGFGLAPAWRLARANLAQQERSGRSGHAAPALVVAQVALALVLTVIAALFIRSLQQLRGVALGYDPQGLVSFNLNATTAGASGPEAAEIYERVAEAAAHLPGVRAASFSQNGLFTGKDGGDPLTVEGYAGEAAANFDKVAPGYFAALGIPVLRGREFTSADASRSPKPIVIDAAFARRYFDGRDPLGRHIQVLFSDSSIQTEVIGVTAVAKQQSPRDDPKDPRFYLDVYNGRSLGDLHDVSFLLRSANPAALNRAAVNAMVARAAGRNLQINSIGAVQARLDTTLAPDLLMVKLTSFFGALGLGLAAMGLYAMLAYAVARRSSELGIRMALGARARQVVGMVLRQAAVLLAIGIALGMAASLAAERGLASLLYGLRPGDPLSLAGAAAALLVAGLAAALVPALRASRVDPLTALREE